MVAELNTWPQILHTRLQSAPRPPGHLSTQTTGVPDCVLGSLVLVAQGIVSQSVEQEVPT